MICLPMSGLRSLGRSYDDFRDVAALSIWLDMGEVTDELDAEMLDIDPLPRDLIDSLSSELLVEVFIATTLAL